VNYVVFSTNEENPLMEILPAFLDAARETLAIELANAVKAFAVDVAVIAITTLLILWRV
jgi:hypothetical protein